LTLPDNVERGKVSINRKTRVPDLMNNHQLRLNSSIMCIENIGAAVLRSRSSILRPSSGPFPLSKPQLTFLPFEKSPKELMTVKGVSLADEGRGSSERERSRAGRGGRERWCEGDTQL